MPTSKEVSIPTTPGIYIPSGYGHYGTVELIELAIIWGYEDNVLKESGLHELTRAYRQSDTATFQPNDVKEPTTFSDWKLNHDEVSEWVSETGSEIESWLNDTYETKSIRQNGPEDEPYRWDEYTLLWGWEDGEFGLWVYDEDGELSDVEVY